MSNSATRPQEFCREEIGSTIMVHCIIAHDPIEKALSYAIGVMLISVQPSNLGYGPEVSILSDYFFYSQCYEHHYAANVTTNKLFSMF